MIVAESVMGRKGESSVFDAALSRPLHSGVEFKLLEERAGWLHIVLPDKTACWVPSASAEII